MKRAFFTILAAVLFLASTATAADPLPAGALKTTDGRVIVPNGNGTYRYADSKPMPAGPVQTAPKASTAILGGCGAGGCSAATTGQPVQRRRLFLFR